MKKRKRISEEERTLFRQAVADVQPLAREPRVALLAPAVPPIPRQRLRDEEQVVKDLLSDPLDPADLEIGDELLFARPGLQHGALRKLRRGQYSIGAELDLHGLTSREAREALIHFLATCHERRIRCVRIIHGKGKGSFNGEPVLKNKVAYWLSQRIDVLAYCSARPVDGGTGAAYVLLKRPTA